MRLASLIENFLSQSSFKVSVLHDGAEAVQTVQELSPDLVILDVMLPNLDGFSICRQIRANYSNPVIFLTAKDSNIDQVLGLEIGADDYIVKPVDPHVLLARINNLFRRFTAAAPLASNQRTLKIGKLAINKTSRQVKVADKGVDLTAHEFDLLVLLAEHAGEILSRDFVHQKMIGREYDGLDRTVDVRISRLRKKLGDDTQNPTRIITVWGKGYTLNPDCWDAA